MSEQVTAEPKKRSHHKKSRVDEQGLSEKRLQVLNRRRKDPLGIPSAPIRLTDSKLECRWFNAGISEAKVWQAGENGWEFVRVTDLADRTQLGGYWETPEGYVARGSRTAPEYLMSMPKDFRDEIQMAKTRQNLKNVGSESRMKGELVEAVAAGLGEEASDFAQARTTVSIKDSNERVHRSETPLE
jgi:hypothetical protein